VNSSLSSPASPPEITQTQERLPRKNSLATIMTRNASRFMHCKLFCCKPPNKEDPEPGQRKETHSTNKLNHTTGFLDLLLCESRNVARLDDDGCLGQAALSKQLGVTESQQVDDGGDTTGSTGKVLLARLSGDEGPQLFSPSAFTPTMTERTHLVEVDGGLPEVVGLLVEVPHTDLTEVTGMVFVHVGPVVVLATSQTTTTGVCVSRIPSAFSPKRIM
jgi:hypothetical protein